jgi:hypothetical protein
VHPNTVTPAKLGQILAILGDCRVEILGRNGQKRTNALIDVQAISVSFDLFYPFYHDCILVGGSA